MVVVCQRRHNEVGGCSPRPHSRRRDLPGHHESKPQERWNKAHASAGYAQDDDFIEHLWETEGLSALNTTLNARERKLKTKKDVKLGGHGITGTGHLPNHLHHRGHVTSPHPNLNSMSKRELDQGDHGAHPVHACCGGFVKDETDIGARHGDGNLQEQCGGLPHFGAKEGARPPLHAAPQHAECFNSSFGLLTKEPRKLRTWFNTRSGCENVNPVATTPVSPCPTVDFMRTSCGSLTSSSPRRHPTQTNDATLHDNSFCDGTIPAHHSSPPGSPFGCPLKTPNRPISAPQNLGSTSALPCAQDDHYSSSCHYQSCEEAQPRTLPRSLPDSSHTTTNQVRNLDICNDFQQSAATPPATAVAEALKTAHQETLCKARNPKTATQLDNMKASILCHAFYPRLVQAYIRRCRVGASQETRKRLRELQALFQDWSPPDMTDFNDNHAVSEFHAMIIAHEEDLETPFQRSMSFCDSLEKELEFVGSRTTSAHRSIPQA